LSTKPDADFKIAQLCDIAPPRLKSRSLISAAGGAGPTRLVLDVEA
jgi:hypothetical protein